MKPKALYKRLVLNKKTIADLRKPEMDEVYGGGPPVPDTYPTYCPTCKTDCPYLSCGPLSECICPRPTLFEC